MGLPTGVLYLEREGRVAEKIGGAHRADKLAKSLKATGDPDRGRYVVTGSCTCDVTHTNYRDRRQIHAESFNTPRRTTSLAGSPLCTLSRDADAPQVRGDRGDWLLHGHLRGHGRGTCSSRNPLHGRMCLEAEDTLK